MRTRVFVVGVLLWISTAVQVSAVSVRDIVELSRAGLGDEVILALIDIDPVRYDLDAPRVLELKHAGVSERVLAAMLRSGRSAAPVVTPVPPASGPARPIMDRPVARADDMARVPDCATFTSAVAAVSGQRADDPVSAFDTVRGRSVLHAVAGDQARRAAAAAGVLGVGRTTTSGHLGPRAAPTGGAIRRRAVRV